MIVAELEVFHSRPVAPTRRVAVGSTLLPMDPPPGHGAMLLAAVAATFAPMLDVELVIRGSTATGTHSGRGKFSIRAPAQQWRVPPGID